jgi:hypothetical protein
LEHHSDHTLPHHGSIDLCATRRYRHVTWKRMIHENDQPPEPLHPSIQPACGLLGFGMVIQAASDFYLFLAVLASV